MKRNRNQDRRERTRGISETRTPHIDRQCHGEGLPVFLPLDTGRHWLESSSHQAPSDGQSHTNEAKAETRWDSHSDFATGWIKTRERVGLAQGPCSVLVISNLHSAANVTQPAFLEIWDDRTRGERVTSLRRSSAI
jgi:hypothetical protein